MAPPHPYPFSAESRRAPLADAPSWLLESECGSGADAIRIARRVLADNARALYGLPA
jgi:hypothetical protein